ncbi:hypothetical protein JW992_15410, partial [candidate division KSB1 bacterium]|nr:hypothetical protein [candidate division KSB1 bacterium]
EMSNFRIDPRPEPGWHGEWQFADRHGYLEPGTPVGLRVIDLTPNAIAGIADTWFAYGFDQGQGELSTLLIQRRSDTETLASLFVDIIEPFRGRAETSTGRLLPLLTPDQTPYGDMHAAVEIHLADGRVDLLVAMDRENPQKHEPNFHRKARWIQSDWQLESDAEWLWVRKDRQGRIIALALAAATSVRVDGIDLPQPDNQDFYEWRRTAD